MADTIERLYKVTVDAQSAVRDLAKIANAAGDISKSLGAAINVVKALGGVLAAAAAAAGLKELADRVHATSEAFDQLGKDAAKVGIAVEDLQRLRYAADLAGVSADKMDKAINALAVGMTHLGDASSETSQILKAIGVTSGDSPSAALAKIADHFAKMPDGVAKLSEAIAIFGKKVGPDLIPWLNDGAAALKKYTDEAARFGGVISTQASAAAQEFNDNLSKLSRTAGGIGRDLVVGMLPALQAITQTLTDSVEASDTFRKAGVNIGEALVVLAKGFVYTSQTVQQLFADIKALAQLKLKPTAFAAIYDEWKTTSRKLSRETEDFVTRLNANFAAAKAAMEAPPKPAGKTTDVEGLIAKLAAQEAAAKAAAKAMDELHAEYERMKKLEEEIRGETVEHALAQRALNDAMKQTNVTLSDNAQATSDQVEANRKAKESIDAQIQAQRDAKLEMQAMLELAEKGTEEQKALAGAWLEHELAIKHAAPVIAHTRDEFDALGEGFDRFVESLSSGSVTAAEAFRGMIQSLIADLLKLWAKKYIIDVIAGMFGKTGGSGGTGLGDDSISAQGHAFASGRVLPFARGGILSRAVTMPMALMGEAGPEAVMPLRRGADGRLGVAGGGASAINVAIHNHTDAQVSARRGAGGDLEVIIEQTRKSVAADIRRGGTDIARAAEAAWRLSRGHAAPF